jgi:hypothetical protein
MKKGTYPISSLLKFDTNVFENPHMTTKKIKDFETSKHENN